MGILQMMEKTLIVITGPTGVGKTDTAIKIAQHLDTEIISADSRQMYRHIPIATAAPSAEQLKAVKHHFVHTLELEEYYSAALFEQQAMLKIKELFQSHSVVVVCGGSMMYVDALCHGIDELPTVPPAIRSALMTDWQHYGDEWLLHRLESLDPTYYYKVDRNNLKRVFHAVEISLTAGQPYSQLLTGEKRQRPFHILKYALTASRDLLFSRINRRVEKMIQSGLEEEARRVYPSRGLNSLNTVGLKEMFRYIEGEWDLHTAIARIQKNTRVYAKKQLTWYRRDPQIRWIEQPDIQIILNDLETVRKHRQ